MSSHSSSNQLTLHGSKYTNKHTNKSYTEDLGKGVKLTLMSIPAGEFTMGASAKEPESRRHERPQHVVKISPFLMGRYPVTQAQWRVVAGYPRSTQVCDLDPDPSYFKGDNRPVEHVNWEDAQEFCRRLSARTGKQYRLPSEAQWEYTCRAGTTTPFYLGETLTPELANYRGTATYNNCPQGKNRQQTTEVGMFPENDWGLHDMLGNVWEWCSDNWHKSYEGAPSEGSAWVDRDRTKTNGVLRGGSWYSYPKNCRSAVRVNAARGIRYSIVGFRVCCMPSRFSS